MFLACFSFIQGWYNPVRLHFVLGYRSPMACEADMQKLLNDAYTGSREAWKSHASREPV